MLYLCGEEGPRTDQTVQLLRWRPRFGMRPIRGQERLRAQKILEPKAKN
jgi:hypothetical protein